MNLQIIISGIGGQGVLFGTKVLSQTALSKGFKVIGSETHGMAQRGGSVVSHLKIGDFLSPLVRSGTADIIYAFEQTEFLRTLPFIKTCSERSESKRSVCFVNEAKSPDVSSGDKLRPDERRGTNIKKYLKEKHIKVFPINADKIALELKTPLSVNLIMLGFSIPSNYLPFSQSEIEQTIRKITPNRFLDMNLKAFRTGYQAWKK